MSSPYLRLASEKQKKKYLPRIIKGEKICAIAITEPSGGSDVAAIHTYAVRNKNGYILNGSKIFITNGASADVFIVVARLVNSMRMTVIKEFRFL